VLGEVIDRIEEGDGLGERGGRRGLSPDDHYGALVRSIVGQQLSTKAARSIYERLLGHFGGGPPTPSQVLAADPEEMRAAAGLSRAKVTFLRSLAEAHVRGVAVDWRRVLAGSGGRPVDLPTYAFHRRRYWIAPDAAVGDLAALGLEAADHALLGAAVPIADTGGCLLTGRISARTQPWLADHVVAGLSLLPGAALVELALRAGDEVGCGHLEELTLETPLALPEHGAVRVQVTLGAPDPDGRRDLAVHSRPEADPTSPWTRHASGFLAPARPEPSAEPAVWPPQGADPVPLDDFYPTLAAAGYRYGPAFQALRAVWRQGPDVYAELVLPADQRRDADRYVLHPVLLDAAVQAAGFATGDGDGAETAETAENAENADAIGQDTEQEPPAALQMPFAWTDVAVHAAGATRLRVRITPAGPDTRSLHLVDTAGDPVAVIGALALRAISAERLEQALKPRGDATVRVERPATRRTADSGVAAALRARIAGRTDAERDRVLLEAVRIQVAAVLGHEDASGIAGDLAFKDLGFDSLTAVDLRNRLGAAVGLRLPATLVFSHPTPAALALYLRTRLAAENGPAAAGAPAADRDLDRLEAALAGAPAPARAEITRRLEAMLRTWRPSAGDSAANGDGNGAGQVLDAGALESVTAEELFTLIDEQLDQS